MLRKMPLHVFFCSAQIQDWRISLCYFVVQKPGTTRWLAACKTLASKSAQSAHVRGTSSSRPKPLQA